MCTTPCSHVTCTTAPSNLGINPKRSGTIISHLMDALMGSPPGVEDGNSRSAEVAVSMRGSLGYLRVFAETTAVGSLDAR